MHMHVEHVGMLQLVAHEGNGRHYWLQASSALATDGESCAMPIVYRVRIYVLMSSIVLGL